MKTSLRLVSLMMTFAIVASCGGSDTTQRTRNAALTERSVLPYSCAQLVTDTATESTTEIRFTLCDAAELYSIVTPDGISGAVNDQAVQKGEEIIVPISSEVNGPSSTLLVKTAGSNMQEDPRFHSGVHIYSVSLATAEEDLFGVQSSLAGTLFPKVHYDAPAPQSEATYRTGLYPSGSPEQYASFIDEAAQKMSMVRLATCHSNAAHANMAGASMHNFVGAFSWGQVNAKLMRNRDLFIQLNALRMFAQDFSTAIHVCNPNERGFNLFSDGIERGFLPMSNEEIEVSTDVLALAKSSMLLNYWMQIASQECAKEEVTSLKYTKSDGSESEYTASELSSWSDKSLERLQVLYDDPLTSPSIRETTRRLLQQIDLLGLVRKVRMSFRTVPVCTISAAGYAVPVKQSAVETVENVSATLPAIANTESSVTISPQPLAEIVTNPSSPDTIAPSQIAWPAATNSPLILRIGETLTRTQLALILDMKVSAKSTVRMKQVTASKKFCSVKNWGVKAIKPGTCKVRISVATKGKKTQTKSPSLQITK